MSHEQAQQDIRVESRLSTTETRLASLEDWGDKFSREVMRRFDDLRHDAHTSENRITELIQAQSREFREIREQSRITLPIVITVGGFILSLALAAGTIHQMSIGPLFESTTRIEAQLNETTDATRALEADVSRLGAIEEIRDTKGLLSDVARLKAIQGMQDEELDKE